jgi:hypothetical protein
MRFKVDRMDDKTGMTAMDKAHTTVDVVSESGSKQRIAGTYKGFSANRLILSAQEAWVQRPLRRRAPRIGGWRDSMIQNISNLLVLITVVPIFAAGLQTKPEDLVAIRHVIRQWDTAWNDHDAKAITSLLTADADTVNRYGLYFRDRAETEIQLNVT